MDVEQETMNLIYRMVAAGLGLGALRRCLIYAAHAATRGAAGHSVDGLLD